MLRPACRCDQSPGRSWKTVCINRVGMDKNASCPATGCPHSLSRSHSAWNAKKTHGNGNPPHQCGPQSPSRPARTHSGLLTCPQRPHSAKAEVRATLPFPLPRFPNRGCSHTHLQRHSLRPPSGLLFLPSSLVLCELADRTPSADSAAKHAHFLLHPPKTQPRSATIRALYQQPQTPPEYLSPLPFWPVAWQLQPAQDCQWILHTQHPPLLLAASPS